ncbi:2'-5' RNA ligase family protein [Natranaerobius trueperi]|uniref:Uncharacterized protein n=1 Tax=Natranaerobius trueperi TaxID=759412 RepID=A0A226BWD0_9FIRM|nr:2'-5' RNA ligase family protein [Natranaerobius trueperi]OWZ83306.1 hypothetical protein CDO51_09200 [Natranaerobius trueperi]
MSIENKLFLVAIPRGRLLKVAQSIQEKLNQKFNIYTSKLPPLHVTIDHISIDDKYKYDKAIKIIKKECDNKNPFELFVKGFSFFDPPYKSINLYVEKTDCLQKLSQGIHTKLKEEGLSSRPFPEEWEFHISLINTTFASREWTDEEFYKAKEIVKEWNINMKCTIEWLELWKPKYEPHLEIEDFFELKGDEG